MMLIRTTTIAELLPLALEATYVTTLHMEGNTAAVRQNPIVRTTTSAETCRMSQGIAQKTVRALFSEIEWNGSAKTLSGKLFQGLVIDYECLQKIRKADCDTEANAVLAEYLYETSTVKTLQEFARILKESGLPKQKVLGEQMEAVLTRTTAATANSTSSEAVSTDSRDEPPQATSPSRTYSSVEDESDEDMETDTGLDREA